VLVADDVVFTEGALAAFLTGPPKGKGAQAVARESELENLADAVSTLGSAPQRSASSRPRRSTSRSQSTESQPSQESSSMSETQGNTSAAGENVSDEEMAAEVEGQTSSDLEAEPQFEAESGGASSDTEAAKNPDEVGE
jgi:hypothetical protein